MLQTNTAAKASCCLTHRYSILSVIVFIPATDAASPMPGKTYMLLHCKHHQPEKTAQRDTQSLTARALECLSATLRRTWLGM